MTELQQRHRKRLIDALADGERSTPLLARKCGLDSRRALKLLHGMQSDGLLYSTLERIRGRYCRVWSLRARARP